MKLLLTAALLIIVLLLTTKKEPFTEIFGFSGYKQPTGTVRFDDSRPDLSGYTQGEADVTNDMMQEFVMLANAEIGKRTGLCTYIIETTSLKKYTNDDKSIYECMFMVVKNSGFAFGFSVVASYQVINNEITLISLRSQPLDVQTVTDVSPFTEGTRGQEFVKYELVKDNAVPKQSELEVAKNKLKLL